MISEAEFRRQLRDWILGKARIARAELCDHTPIIERRIVTSLQVMDLILFLEELRGTPINVENLKPGMFRSIDAIVAHFFEGAKHGA